MTSFLFYISLFLVVVMLIVKSFNFSFVSNKNTLKVIHKSDRYCYNIICVIRYFLSKIKIKNFNKIFLFIINFAKRETVYLKRRFDSKQPKFFLKPKKSSLNSKSSVSFFLKNVSEYKDSLRNKDIPHQ
ncbi:MAG: hypothetical protein WCR40_00995 [Candidatus Paceibacterota bacterium]